MPMTDDDKYIHNIKYVIAMLENKEFTRNEIIQILKNELERTMRVNENKRICEQR
jgi:hypothetical protein